MFTLVRSSDFDGWLSNFADLKGKARVLARLKSAALGNLGDCEFVGDGVFGNANPLGAWISRLFHA